MLFPASLHTAGRQHAEIEASPLSTKPGGGQQGFGLLRAMAISAPPNTAYATDWGHSNASFCPWQTEADTEAFAHNNEQLLRAATFCAAEFRVSRDYALGSCGNHLFEVLIAADSQLTGWRQGRHLGLVSFRWNSSQRVPGSLVWAAFLRER